MRVLSVIHESDGRSGVFGEVVEEAGHELVEWNVAEEGRLPAEEFDAILVFGGTMHVDQDEHHGWLRDEDAFLRRLVADGVPVLGVCLGGQLLAKALRAPVRRMPSPQVGWHEVRLEPGAEDDPVLGGLPARFQSFQWHSYAFELPRGAVLLAQDNRCNQAFRAGASTWALQFHAEVTRDSLREWIESAEAKADGTIDFDRLRTESEAHIARWNEIGREICGRYVAVAEDLSATQAAATTRATSPRS